MNRELKNLMNIQINKELSSAYLYKAIACVFAELNLNGFAHWYTVQADEEIEHADRFITYLHDQSEDVTLTDIGVIPFKHENIIDMLEESLTQEIMITASINNLYAEAITLHDYRAMKFLDWFIAEQHEEEVNAKAMIDKYQNFVCDCGCGLYELDKELSERS